MTPEGPTCDTEAKLLIDDILEIGFLINQVRCNMVVPISDLHENDNMTMDKGRSLR